MVECADKAPHEIPQPPFCCQRAKTPPFYYLLLKKRFSMKTFKNPILTKPEAEQALDTAIALVRRNLPLYTDHCQNHSSVHDIYPQCENNQWTCGFWPGEVWLSYERTGDEAFKNTALTLVDSFLYRIEHKIEVDHHDMGFLYSPSCVAAYKLTGSEKEKGRYLGCRPALHPLSGEGRVLSGVGRARRCRQLPLHHRLPAERAAALLGQRDHRRRPLRRSGAQACHDLSGQLHPPGRLDLPHLLHGPRDRRPCARRDLSGL